MKRLKYLFLLMLFPLFGHAEGQAGLSFFLDLIDFVKVFALWAIIVFPTIILLNKFRANKLTLKIKMIFIFGTGLIALFVWSMIKFDSDPWNGPIDSIIYKDKNEAFRKQDSINIYEGYSDSTIDETLASVDTSAVGIYIWLHKKRIFVRKHNIQFDSQRQEDSLTMSIVRSWKTK